MRMFSTQAFKTMLRMNFKFEINGENGLWEQRHKFGTTINTPEKSTATYEFLKKLRGTLSPEVELRSSTNITLSGKLNGVDIDKQFYDLKSYKDFLEENSLLSKPTCELKPN